MPTYEYHAIRAEGDDEKSFIGGVVVAHIMPKRVVECFIRLRCRRELEREMAPGELGAGVVGERC